MKIKSVELRNFQAHVGLRIEFSPRITTIVGATDKGKSAILRAIRWACLNDFSGDSFITEGAKTATVLLDCVHQKQPHEVLRTRGAENAYELDGEEYKAFGSAVPDQIAKLLSLSEINFQAQHDPPFWFCLSAPEVSRRLNSVIDLSVIDTTLSNISNEVRRANERVGLRKEELETAEQTIEQLRTQEHRIDDFANLRRLHKEMEERVDGYAELAGLLDKIEENNADDLAKKAGDLQYVAVLAKSVIVSERKCADLADLIKEASRLSSVQAPPDFEEVDSAFQACEDVNEEIEKLFFFISQIESASARVVDATTRRTAAETRFQNQTSDQLCPTCGKPL